MLYKYKKFKSPWILLEISWNFISISWKFFLGKSPENLLEKENFHSTIFFLKKIKNLLIKQRKIWIIHKNWNNYKNVIYYVSERKSRFILEIVFIILQSSYWFYFVIGYCEK